MGMTIKGKIDCMKVETSKDGSRTYTKLQIYSNGGGGNRPSDLQWVTDMSGVKRVYGSEVELPVSIQAYVGKNGSAGVSYTHWGNEGMDEVPAPEEKPAPAASKGASKYS